MGGFDFRLQIVQPRRRARRQVQADAFGRQPLGYRPADTLGRAGDDRRPAGKMGFKRHEPPPAC